PSSGNGLGCHREPVHRPSPLHIAGPLSLHCTCPRSMMLDPRLGAHVLCFELSDECSETRWERHRECIFVLELEAAPNRGGCCGSPRPAPAGLGGRRVAV